MSAGFVRKREHKRYARETDDFILSEIEYAERMVAWFGQTNDHRDELFVRSARRYTDALRLAYEIASDKRHFAGGEHAEFRRRFLEAFPQFIQDLTSALYQRDEARPLRTSAPSISERSFAPSEVTLEYPVTIRAAEAVNEDYHRRLLGFFGNQTLTGTVDVDRHAPPLVSLSGSTAATLRSRYSIWLLLQRTELGAEIELDEGKLFAHIAQRLNDSSCITLPRWSSQHVRTYAFAAHEHMHRVLWRTQLLRVFARDAYTEMKGADANADRDFQQALEDPEKLKRVARAFFEFPNRHADAIGTPLVRLFTVNTNLFQHIWNFFRMEKIRYDPTNALLEPSRTMAYDQSIEILADIGALVISGPAFAFAYRSVFTPDTDKEVERLYHGQIPHHPPTALRIQLQIHLLRQLGFKRIATYLEKDFAAEWKEVREKHPVVERYMNLLRHDVYSHLTFLVDLVRGVAGSAHAYDLPKRKEEGLALASESAVLRHWEAIAVRIEHEARYLPNDVLDLQPADAINAIWWKRIREGGAMPKNRLAWRVALRNCHTKSADETGTNA
jgi:hypothetical protein